MTKDKDTRPTGFRPRGRGGRHFAMSLPTEKPLHFKMTLRRLLHYIRPHLLSLLFVVLAAIMGTIFTILTPRLIGEVTTIIYSGLVDKMNNIPGAIINFGQIKKILFLLVGLYLVSSLFLYLEHIVMAGVSQRTVFELRKEVNNKITHLPLKYLDSQPHGEILSRVTNDMDLIGSTLHQSMTQVIEAIITLVGVLIMMLLINHWLTLITLVTLPLSFAITVLITRHSQKHFARQQKELGELNGHIEEMYGGHLVVKAFNYEKHSLERFQNINQRLYAAGWQAQFLSGIIMPLLALVNNMGYVFIAVVGSIFVTRGLIAIGHVQAFFQYSKRFSHPIVQTANIANLLQSTIAAAERIFQLLDEEEEIPDRKGALEQFLPRGNVHFADVSFSYRKDEPLIKNLNIDIRAGQTVAIVGPTGAGKTTLVNLMLRFYEVDTGTISIDDVDIKNIRRGGLRNIFGMVLQDTWLFKGTIGDNIAYGREGATTKDIVQAAQAAHADHFIRTLPQGYNTILNEEASNISYGQRQLLTIARALLADPPILILDEATSNVDTRTEILIQSAMARLMEGRTTFVIAHRLSTIRNADVILVMNKGEIIEQGTHEELLAREGFYAHLYRSQFSAA